MNLPFIHFFWAFTLERKKDWLITDATGVILLTLAADNADNLIILL